MVSALATKVGLAFTGESDLDFHAGQVILSLYGLGAELWSAEGSLRTCAPQGGDS